MNFMLRPNITPENTIVGSFITMNPRANLRKIFGEQREVKKNILFNIRGK